jgi:uncharacterized protein
MTATLTRIVRCPVCQTSSEYSSRNPYRPFCSERCRLQDLGAWARGDYVVASEASEQEDSLTPPAEDGTR